MIGWILIDVAFAAVQYERHGFVSNSMILVCALQAFYVLHYFWQESFVLSTIDIRTERFGWMLVYGDLAWVPMTYCLGAFFLIDHVHSLPLWGALVILLFNIAGLFVRHTLPVSPAYRYPARADPYSTLQTVIIWLLFRFHSGS